MLFSVIIIPTWAQTQQPSNESSEFICATDMPPSNYIETCEYSTSTDPNFLDTFEPISFNIFYWRINKSDGSYSDTSGIAGEPLTPQKVLESVQALNEAYAPLKVCFNLIGMDTINATAYHTGANVSQIHTYAEGNGYEKINAFNIYVPHRLNQGTGQGVPNNTYLVVNDAGVTPAFINHEMGHNFNLRHTFGAGNVGPSLTNCEHVTRNENDPDYNADEAGDEIRDTNAVQNFFREQHNYVASAIANANLGYNWGQARLIAFLEEGFHDLPDAIAIEQALVDYGFTQLEINHLKFNPAVDYAYCNRQNCTYNPDSRVNNPNLEFFKDCEGTPYDVTAADIHNLMSYYHPSCRNLFSVGQKIRMRETIECDSNEKFQLAIANKDIDMYISDTETDIGQEPNIHTEIFWNSKDIWVRNQNDGVAHQEHQNPEYDPVDPNYVYVKVKNKGCGSSSGNDLLKLYWAKANTALNWPDNWNGSLYVNGVLMGDEIATMSIPSIMSGHEEILTFQWHVPNPDDYAAIGNDNPWHFCLLARIESTDDPMTYPEGTFITDNVKNNNNIAWKNTTVIDIVPNTLTVGAVVAISNPFSVSKTFSLELKADGNEPGKSIYEEAEIGVEMDAILFDAWETGSKTGSNFNTTFNEKKIIATNNNMIIDNIEFDANEYGTAYITFNFLTEELTNKQHYTYQVIQRDKATNKIVGGETFEIKKQPRSAFFANAGNNREIEKNDSTTLQATDVNENAVYNWYDPNGNLIYTGRDLTVSPEITQQYQLEIISDVDGLKDYDEVVITVNNPFKIESMSPNPVNSQLTINYAVIGATSAYIMVVNQSTASSDNYIIDTNNNEVTLDMTSYPAGLYSVVLVCNGDIQDSKNLAKQ